MTKTIFSVSYTNDSGAKFTSIYFSEDAVGPALNALAGEGFTILGIDNREVAVPSEGQE